MISNLWKIILKETGAMLEIFNNNYYTRIKLKKQILGNSVKSQEFNYKNTR